jgi:hypothetical protein
MTRLILRRRHPLRSNTGEEHDVADDPAYAATLAELKDRLLT